MLKHRTGSLSARAMMRGAQHGPQLDHSISAARGPLIVPLHGMNDQMAVQGRAAIDSARSLPKLGEKSGTQTTPDIQEANHDDPAPRLALQRIASRAAVPGRERPLL